jgi:uncharacterized membrane protein
MSHFLSNLDKYDLYVALAAIAITLLAIRMLNRMPSTASIQDAVSVLNTRGGQILVLSVMSMTFFFSTLLVIVLILSGIKSGTLREDNSIALLAIQFCTTGAFGGTMGAMLTLLTGEKAAPKSPDAPTKPTLDQM